MCCSAQLVSHWGGTASSGRRDTQPGRLEKGKGWAADSPSIAVSRRKSTESTRGGRIGTAPPENTRVHWRVFSRVFSKTINIGLAQVFGRPVPHSFVCFLCRGEPRPSGSEKWHRGNRPNRHVQKRLSGFCTHLERSGEPLLAKSAL